MSKTTILLNFGYIKETTKMYYCYVYVQFGYVFTVFYQCFACLGSLVSFFGC